MRTLWWLPLAIALPLVSSMHDAGCVPQHANPATTMVFDVGDDRYYVECRQPFPPCATGALGEAMWVYREANDVDGLQRGGMWPLGCIPGDQSGGRLPCILIDEDPINDVHCGHGPDELIY